MFKTVVIEKKDNIAILKLNRPESNNSFDAEMILEAGRAIEELSCDTGVRVIIITGHGKNFSVGGDINAMATMDFVTEEVVLNTSEMSGAVRKCPKPVIAMVNGAAAGAGFGLALACDFRIVTEKSTFLSAFANMGFPGDTGVIYHLYHIAGLAKTIEIMALSEPVKGREALNLGLATKLVDEDRLLEETLAFAELLASKAPLAIAGQKELYYRTFYHDYEQFRQLEASLMFGHSKTEDHKEAVAAFFEKRKPNFKGV